ncbi:hypothetical protein K438DRAFT_1969460 [Mycena galopus ATCC 62051]|nr:hypothetical protein K438DRAFT_1969460 [Mycena galopus ATCC 62051]
MARLAAVEGEASALVSQNTKLKENNDVLVAHADNLGRKLHNKTRQANRARASVELLRTDLRRSKHSRIVQAGRLGRRKKDGIRKALHDARAESNKHWMKGKGGIFTEKSREMFRDLVALKIAAKNVDPVIQTVGRGLGVEVQDTVSARQINRVVEEGGIASDIQVAAEIKAAGAFVLSGDGTTIRHVNFEANTRPPNHTSEAQLSGWKSTINDSLVGTYNASPLGQANPIDNDEFITFIKGLGSDHAADQKKWARLTNEWTTGAHKIMLGKEYLLQHDMRSYLPEIARRNDAKIQAAGGLDAWNALSEEEKTKCDIQVFRELCAHFGETEWKGLWPQDRFDREFLVWCGCCMHKEMNAVRGGVEAIKLFWEAIGGPVPVKLMNKANDAAASNSAPGSKAAEHADNVSEGGAVKLTSLLGALFNHKDDKKGQQDTFKLYFEEFLGYTVSCPDTSNTRFQCHCDCAIFILLHLTQILEFMMHVMYSKTKIGLNHLELNVLKGLKCTSTLTELAVLAIYANAVSYPYMRVARGLVNGVRPNALDLGPWHAKVVEFCEAIAENVELLLAPDATHKTGTPTDSLGSIRTFFTSSNGWPADFRIFRFGEEYKADGIIANLSPAARAKIYINPTNDHNEGALGRLRSAMRASARLSLTMHNAKFKYSINDTREFLRSDAVTAALRVWLRGEARRRIDSGRDRKRRAELIQHEKVAVQQKKDAESDRKAKEEKKKSELAKLTPLLDTVWISANHSRIKGTDIVQQINWHRQFVEKGVIPMKTLINAMSKPDKVAQLIIAVTRFNQDTLPKLQLLADAARTAGMLDVEMPQEYTEIPVVENWDAREEEEEADMLDDY